MTLHIIFVITQNKTEGIVRYLSDISKTQRRDKYVEAQSLSRGKWLMTLQKNKSENMILKK